MICQSCRVVCICLGLLLAFAKPCQAYSLWPQTRQSGYCVNHVMGDFVANPEDCRLFYWCGENGESVPASCPPNMIFNADTKLCDTTDNVQCDSTPVATRPPAPVSTITPPTPTSPDVANSNANQFCLNLYAQQPTSNALVFIASPSNCYQYYMCYHGQALLQECSSNLYWNSKIGKCDLPANVNCLPPVDDTNSVQVLPPLDENVGGLGSFTCPLYGHHIFPHMERCDFFIYCVKGYAILQKCPFFHYFDVESGKCKWRTSALCVKDLNLKFRLKKRQ